MLYKKSGVMKTAIVCDWLVTVGGAEKFLGHLLNCFPKADLFAVIDFVPTEQRAFLQEKKITTTFLQRFPLVKKFYRHYLPLMPLAIEQLDVSNYDLVISSSHAVAKGVLTGPDQLHISYVHSPMRYAWDLQHQYLRETGLDKKARGLLARYFLHKMRLWDNRTAQNVDYFVANSNFIQKRIWKTYKREATVIYPPIELDHFIPGKTKENFFLAISRMVPYKRMDLIVESFKHLPDKQLVVIGDGPDFQKVKCKAGKNVTLLGRQEQSIVIDYMQRAKALIFAAEEDFGLIPVEAQACGTPVIAFAKGGALETIQSNTGVFFDEQTIGSLCQGVMAFCNRRDEFTIENCVKNAARFSPTRFEKEFKAYIASIKYINNSNKT